MLELIRKDAVLYAKVLMKLRLPIEYKNRVFNTGEKVELITSDEAMAILTRNGNIKFWNGEKYIKLDLGQFYRLMQKKDYIVIDYVEPKKEEVKPEPPKQQPKVVEEPKPVEKPEVEAKPEPKQEEVKQEQPKQQPKKEEYKQNDNKKQRHNNNNNNKQQGGDK